VTPCSTGLPRTRVDDQSIPQPQQLAARRATVAVAASQQSHEHVCWLAVKLVVADDQKLIRTELAVLLAGKEIQIAAKAATGNEAITLTERHKPDVLLLDVRMPDMDGLDALEQIRENTPATKVIMISAYDNPSYVARAVVLGAEDFLLKDSPREAYVAAIHRAVAGGELAAETLFSQIKATLHERSDPKADDVPLTRREYQVLRHLAYGLSNREIARSLTISIETVKEHVQNTLRKLELSNRTEAAIWIVKRGLV
jgi:DNA-binding NarL/FixJ family response regulator